MSDAAPVMPQVQEWEERIVPDRFAGRTVVGDQGVAG